MIRTTDAALHPVIVLRRLGVRDLDVGLAIGLLLASQVLLILAVFKNYSNATEATDTGFSLDSPVRWVAIPLPFLAAMSLSIRFVCNWCRRDSLHRQLEKPAKDESFGQLRDELEELKAKTRIIKPVLLCYHILGTAPYSTRDDNQDRIVIGANLRSEYKSKPDLVRSIIAHELSHLELGETRRERWTRRVLWVYSILVVGLLLSLVLFVLFLAPSMVARNPIVSISFVPQGHLNPLEQFGGHLILALINLAAVSVFGFFFVVRREFAHDLRACQLAGSKSLLTNFFAPRCQALHLLPRHKQILVALRDFAGLHPSDCERARKLEQWDCLMINAGLYPAICGLLFPALILLTAPLHDILKLSLAASNLVSVMVLTVLTFIVLRADVIRFAIAWILRRNTIRLGIRYCLVLTISSILTGCILAVWYLHRHSNSIGWLVLQWRDSLLGGVRLFVFYSSLLCVQGYISSIRICAFGESLQAPVVVIERVVAIFITLLAEILVSMRTLKYVEHVIAILVGILIASILCILACSRCHSCRRIRMVTLRGQSQCPHCGHEHIPNVRAVAG